MAKRKIVKFPDERLRRISKKVTDFDDELSELLDDMRETMYANDGMGLAAPQVGIPIRAVVMDVNGNFFELINPEIVRAEGEQIDDEGCLSVGPYNDKVKRPYKVTVKAQDRFGYHYEITGEKYFARCASHEIDHLDGKLFIDISENGQDYIKTHGKK